MELPYTGFLTPDLRAMLAIDPQARAKVVKLVEDAVETMYARTDVVESLKEMPFGTIGHDHAARQMDLKDENHKVVLKLFFFWIHDKWLGVRVETALETYWEESGQAPSAETTQEV